METVIVIGTAIVLFSVCSFIYTVRCVKKQISEMVDALEDVKNGNGNRRILSGAHELAVSLAYEINDIILSYENRLSEYHQMEETNRQLMTCFSHDVRTPLTTLLDHANSPHNALECRRYGAAWGDRECGRACISAADNLSDNSYFEHRGAPFCLIDDVFHYCA